MCMQGREEWGGQREGSSSCTTALGKDVRECRRGSPREQLWFIHGALCGLGGQS
jgi:hypothetical protein